MGPLAPLPRMKPPVVAWDPQEIYKSVEAAPARLRRLVAGLLVLVLAIPMAATAQEPPEPKPECPQPQDAQPQDPQPRDPQPQDPQPQDKHDPSVAAPRGDERRTMKSYLANLGYNFMGVFTRGNWIPLGVGVAATAPAFLLDDETVDYFNRHDHQTFGDVGAFAGGGILVAGVSLGLLASGRVARGGRFRATTYDYSQAIVVTSVYTFAIKVTVRRVRPDGSNRQSFPSGHASTAFAGATVISRHYGLKTGAVAYTAASLISISRLASHKHYLSDVVAGAAFGVGVGRAVVRRNSRPLHPASKALEPEVALLPTAGPGGSGAGLAISIQF